MGNLKANIELNRKMLAQMAVLDPASFSKVAELASQKDEGGKQRIIFPCFFFFLSFLPFPCQ